MIRISENELNLRTIMDSGQCVFVFLLLKKVTLLLFMM